MGGELLCLLGFHGGGRGSYFQTHVRVESFFVLRAVDFFGVDGVSGLPIVLQDTYLEEVLAGDSVLQSPERFGRVLSPIEQRRLCDRQVFTPPPLSGRGLFLARCAGLGISAILEVLRGLTR